MMDGSLRMEGREWRGGRGGCEDIETNTPPMSGRKITVKPKDQNTDVVKGG
jgi:hypothetical protein